MEHRKRKKKKRWSAATFKQRQLLNVLTWRHFIEIVSIASATWTSVRWLKLYKLLWWCHWLDCGCWLFAHHQWVEGSRWDQRLWRHWQWILALKFSAFCWCGVMWHWIGGRNRLRFVKVDILLLRRWTLALENWRNARGDVQTVEWIWLRKKL